ncbi:Down syndrome cell adhesion molecule precursor [Danaus plexippus plexippus]|uniref:Down syndrome cell adhesion molecule n=1 Tax=Danaus plexippus plexippus TaxID=278856 RepID=A0A212F7V0_DANPL|nr:Down syndrome cell adhesion molecule precursor [Danaus plexippus plexippus]
MEPPPRLSFSNSTGARVSCAAHGSPTPTITWLTEDGVPVSDIPGLSLIWQQTIIRHHVKPALTSVLEHHSSRSPRPWQENGKP